MKASVKLTLAAIVGALGGAAVTAVLLPASEENTGGESAREPLYWVAPMDSSYRRDKPGKSPMGMDLVPVYEEGTAAADPGTVKISPRVENNLGVRTATVSFGKLPSSIETVGYVQYNEDRLVHVHPRVAGWIETLHVKAAGDPVREGEPLYTVYSPALVNAQEEYILALKRGNPMLTEAAAERLRALQVPESSIERLRASGRVSRTVTQVSPQDGVVDDLAVREGMYVEPGMQVMSIGTLADVWVIAEVFERQFAQVQLGDPVRMTLDYRPGRSWQGEVDTIYPTLNARTRTVRLRVRVPNPDEFLRPGMFAQMEIDTGPAEETLLVPREAIIRTGSQSRVVLALGEGRFKSVAVDVGRTGGEQAEVLGGLRAGDSVVTSAQFLIDSESSKASDFARMDPHAAMDHSGHESMDHSMHGDGSEPAEDHSGHEGMDHSMHGEGSEPAMDHSNHEGMDHAMHGAGAEREQRP